MAARKKRATGGRTIRDEVMSKAKETSSSGFKRGGATKEMEGDMSDSPPARADRRARGGRTGPFSSGNASSDRPGKSSSGHEGE